MDASSSCADHCPFLNRRDARCGEHMSLDGLHHAFDYCFGAYRECPAYLALLSERLARRGQAANAHARMNRMSQLDAPAAVSITIGRRAYTGRQLGAHSAAA